MSPSIRLAVLACLPVLIGCHSGRVATYPVSGRAIFSDGVAVRSGIVELQSLAHGTTATGTIRDDGTFVLGTYTPHDGAAVGKHKAIVVQLLMGDGVTKHHKNHGRQVPPRFGDYESSGLTADVRAIEKNEIVLTLDSKKE